MKVIIDTNVWLMPGQFGTDIFREIKRVLNIKYEITTLSGIIEELKKIISEQKGKNVKAAKLGMVIIEKKKIKIIPFEGGIDDGLVEFSKNNNLIVTQDIELKKKLKKPYLTFRKKTVAELIS